MKCAHCGQEHPDDFKFCPETGQAFAPQTKVCGRPTCQYPNVSMEAKFCPRCGWKFPMQKNEIQEDRSTFSSISDINASHAHVHYPDTQLSNSDTIDKDDIELIVNWICSEFYDESGIDWKTDPEMMSNLKEIVNKSIDKYNASLLHRANVSIPYVLKLDKNGRPVHTRNFERELSRKVFYSLKYPNMIEDTSWGWVNVASLKDSLCLKRYGNKYGVVDTDGVILLPCEYENIMQLDSGNIVIRKDGKYGVINKNRSINIACKYDQIKDFTEGLCEVRLGNIWYKINESGIIVEVKESDDWLYSMESKFISILGIAVGKTDISSLASIGNIEGLGKILCYSPFLNEDIVYFQRINQDYVSAVIITDSEICIKMRKTVRYLGLTPTKYKKDDCTISVYQTNDMLWKFAFCEWEKSFNYELLIDYADGLHIMIDKIIEGFTEEM